MLVFFLRQINLVFCAHSTMGGVGIDLELWRARIGMFHASRCRRQRRGKTSKMQIPIMRICLLALVVGMMVSLTPAVVNMLLLLGGDIEPNPGPGQLSITSVLPSLCNACYATVLGSIAVQKSSRVVMQLKIIP